MRSQQRGEGLASATHRYLSALPRLSRTDRHRWERTASPVLGRSHRDVLLGGRRGASCLQGRDLALRCQDDVWRGRRWSCLPFLLPHIHPCGSSHPWTGRLLCVRVALEKNECPSLPCRILFRLISTPAVTCRKIITRASGSLLRNKGFLNSGDREEDKALPCYLKQSIYA